MRDFEAEGTDAYRLWTIVDGWVERLGSDVLISFKNQAARERLTTEYFLSAGAIRALTRNECSSVFCRSVMKEHHART